MQHMLHCVYVATDSVYIFSRVFFIVYWFISFPNHVKIYFADDDDDDDNDFNDSMTTM